MGRGVRRVRIIENFLVYHSESDWHLSLNGDVDGEPLGLAMMAVRRGLNRGDGSANSSSDVDGVGGNMLNCEHGLASEDKTDEVGEVQERSEERLGMGGCGKL